MSDENKTYTLRVRCGNCRRIYEIEIPYGKKWLDCHHIFGHEYGRSGYEENNDIHVVYCKFCGTEQLYAQDKTVNDDD
jgi:transcription elongation factor Elf1